jgi:hypothetical protein
MPLVTQIRRKAQIYLLASQALGAMTRLVNGMR